MPTTITFSATPQPSFSRYEEQGFAFTTEGNYPDAFWSGVTLNPVGDGDYIFVNYSNDRAIVQSLDGHTFGALAIDLNGFAWTAPAVPGAAAVTFFFRGYLADVIIDGAFRTDNVDTFQTVNLTALDPRFSAGLYAFQWWAGDNTAWGSVDNLVIQTNRAPTAQDFTATAPAGALYAGQAVASDPDGQALRFELVGPAPAGVRMDQDGRFYVTPTATDAELAAGQSRLISFQYRASDGDLASVTRTVAVTLQGQVPPGQSISGSQHPDKLTGGDGPDTLRGYQNNDTLIGGGGDDRLTGDQDSDWLDGGSGRDTLDGGNGPDTLIGGPGDDYLIGGEGPDQFRFTAGSGDDVIADFDPKTDTLMFNAAMFGADSTFAGVMSRARQLGASVVITYMGEDDRTHTITLLDVSKASLKADDFLFG